MREAPEPRHEVRFVGRVRELALLGEAWGSAIESGRCELATNVGEAAVGKWRLVAELVAALGVRLRAGVVFPCGEGITYWPARLYCDEGRWEEAADILSHASDEAGDDSRGMAVKRLAVEARLAADSGRLAQAVRLAERSVARAEARKADLNLGAIVWATVAEVQRAGGHTAEADAAVARALELYEQKGNVAAAACLQGTHDPANRRQAWSVEQWSCEWVACLDACKSAIVAVVCPDRANAVLHHEGDQVGVWDEVAARVGFGCEVTVGEPEAIVLAGSLDVRERK